MRACTKLQRAVDQVGGNIFAYMYDLNRNHTESEIPAVECPDCGRETSEKALTRNGTCDKCAMGK